ncbi:MAG TPA: winged helix-turn-helix domain-containing protein [Thermoanaerobaculaceae bacterium]|nr:winged helix-turn-helix domain-containing protein [Thermoanaerobaculaceae bacterium]HPS76725.1 winged helix-turn-helix domain-containing protein [Thermoanaerobaculaceae bacterium]
MTSINMIGEAAGKVWHFLDEHGRSSLATLENGIEAPRGMVLMAVGWLAREGKVELAQEGRTTIAWLRGD